MRINRVLAITTILIGGVLAFSSCEQSTSPEIEESINIIQNVSAISGAQNATMDLQNDRDNAQFIVEFSNIEPNNLINNGTKEAWCIEWDDTVINGTQEEVKLYSTKGKQEWQELNYFLSQKDKLKKQDPDLTWKEIQVVIWALVPFKPFDVDKIPTYQNFDQQFYSNGEYLFDVQKVKTHISSVKNDVSSLNKLKAVDIFSVYAVVVENNGQTIIVEGEETFWAFGKEYCFRSDNGQQWGWVYGFDASSENNTESTPLVAGAGQSVCPDETVEDTGGTIVGNVTIEKAGDELTITLSVLANSDVVIDVVHIDADDDLQALKDRIINNGGNVAPGRFPIAWSDDDDGEFATEVTFTLSISENDLTGSSIFFAIHGVSATLVQ